MPSVTHVEDAEPIEPEEQEEPNPSEPEEELIVEIDGEELPAEEDGQTPEEVEAAPKWVKEVRAKNRELEKELRALKRAAQPAAEPPPAAPAVGEKPTLEGCDHDVEEFEQKLLAWNERKRAAEEQQRQQMSAKEKQKAEWDAELARYGTLKADLRAKLRDDDFDEVEARVADALTPDQQAIIVRGAANPAAMIHAIGRNAKVLAELVAIKDIARFAVEIGRLESRVKVTPRKPATAPEEPLRGAASGTGLSATPTKQLDKLRAEAEKTGDYTKVTAYKRQMREASQK